MLLRVTCNRVGEISRENRETASQNWREIKVARAKLKDWRAISLIVDIAVVRAVKAEVIQGVFGETSAFGTKKPVRLLSRQSGVFVPLLEARLHPLFGFIRRLRCGWIVRPEMFLVLDAQFFLHFLIGILPEARQVAGDLYRALGGG